MDYGATAAAPGHNERVRWFARLWTLWARLRQRHAWRQGVPREELVRRFASGQSFVDVGSQPFLLGSDLQTDRVMERPVG